ncbi:MAG TPA: tetrahydromethanopterin S-methyltransferase subunit H [Anaerolineae bacterium]|nr:tetrahydromethanopterin S-methyltransferase subunit H [Anaerolineae bacterium]
MSLKFRYDKEQRVCDIGGIKVGGQPGENPPLLLASLFQKGDKLVESRKNRKFDRKGATDRIKEMEEISDQTGVPGMVAMVANSPEEMKAYVDFFVSVSDRPFAIDIWVQNTRVEATRYICEQGLADRLLYNSITPWDEDIPGQVETLKELGVKHIVVQAFDVEDKTPTGRPKSLRKMMELVGTAGFESILVDTAVMNLPATAFSLLANSLVKDEFGVPVGSAPSNGTYMWKASREKWGSKGFVGVDAGIHAVSTLASDFMLYGPMTGTQRIFPAVAAASAVLATLVYDDTGTLPKNKTHPLNLLFSDMVEQLVGK